MRLQETLGVAFLVIGHSPGMLARIAGEILVMYAGRIVERGAPAQVLRSPLHPYTAGLLGSLRPQGGNRFYSIPGNPPPLTARAAGCPFEPRCDERMDRCVTAMPLEVAREEAPEEARFVRCFKYAV